MTGRRPGWLLDEVASAGRENLDGEHVLRYDVKEDAVAAAEVDLLRSWGLDAGSVEGGFLTYEHQGGPADIVYSRYALHHLPDFWKGVALGRIHGMLRPGGIFRMCDVVYGFDPAVARERIEAWCATGGEDVEAEWSRAELEEHVRDEHSTYTWLLEPMLERTGFVIEDTAYEDGIVARYVARAL